MQFAEKLPDFTIVSAVPTQFNKLKNGSSYEVQRIELVNNLQRRDLFSHSFPNKEDCRISDTTIELDTYIGKYVRCYANENIATALREICRTYRGYEK
jgi:hypothetical protein